MDDQQTQQAPQEPQQQFAQAQPPVGKLKTDRSLLLLILLSIVTLGIYGLIFWYKVSKDINLIASRYDGKTTMNYALLVFLIAPITLGIGALVWEHKFCNRVGEELARRNIDFKISASDFWIWGVLLGFTIVCPIILVNKQINAMNKLTENYNTYG